MFCKKCGKKIDDDSIFCAYCGESLYAAKSNKDSHKSQNQTSFKPTHENNLLSETTESEKFDILYKSNKILMKYGISLLIVFLILNIISIVLGGQSETFNQVVFYINLSSMVLRIILCFWVVRYVREMNRNKMGWIIFTLLLPGIALITLATKNKILYPKNYLEYNQLEQSNFLNDYASRLAKNNYLDYAERFINRALKLDPNNHFAFDTRGYIKLLKNDFKSAVEDFNISIKMNNSYGEKFFNRGFAKYKQNDFAGAISDLIKAKDLGYNKAEHFLSNHNLSADIH